MEGREDGREGDRGKRGRETEGRTEEMHVKYTVYYIRNIHICTCINIQYNVHTPLY